MTIKSRKNVSVLNKVEASGEVLVEAALFVQYQKFYVMGRQFHIVIQELL